MFEENCFKSLVTLSKAEGFVTKFISDINLLQKEYFIQEVFGRKKISPEPYDLSLSDFFFRQKLIQGNQITANDLTDENIKKLASTLRAVHSTKIPFEIEGYTKNEYLIDKIYNPVLVCDKILEKAPVYFLQKYGNILREKMEEYKKVIDKSPYKIGLIHGDLRGSNILLSEGGISLIDWADSRLDIISCDIAQLFYLLDFNQLQEHAFLKKYPLAKQSRRVGWRGWNNS